MVIILVSERWSRVGWTLPKLDKRFPIRCSISSISEFLRLVLFGDVLMKAWSWCWLCLLQRDFSYYVLSTFHWLRVKALLCLTSSVNWDEIYMLPPLIRSWSSIRKKIIWIGSSFFNLVEISLLDHLSGLSHFLRKHDHVCALDHRFDIIWILTQWEMMYAFLLNWSHTTNVNCINRKLVDKFNRSAPYFIFFVFTL